MSGVIESRFRRCSHCDAKLVTSERERLSTSIRFTCRSSTAGSWSLPVTAASSSSSSGTLLQRKKDSRDASWRSVMRYGVFDASPGGSRSTRNRNSGLTRTPGIEMALSGVLVSPEFLFRVERELRTHQDARQRHLD